ncbi:MAG: cobaltochelatase subunit CobN [Candidatus Jettenia sp. AMX1]|nr:cobaltochelatase subunit CobN [Candidatus Jettenia sp. AMX1]
MRRYAIFILFIIFTSYLPFSHAEEARSLKYTFIVGNYLTPTVIKAIKNTWKEYPSLKNCIDFELVSTTDLDSGFNPHEIEDADIVVIDIMGIRISTATQAGFDQEAIKKAISRGAHILPINHSAGLDKEYIELGLTYDEEFRSYFDSGGIENFQNMLLFSLKKYAGVSGIKTEPPEKLLKNGYYHRHNSQGMFFETFEEYESWYKEKGYCKKDAKWVAVLTYSSFCEQGQNQVEDDIIRTLEEKGLNAFVAFGYPEGAAVERLLVDSKGVPRVSGILSFLFRFSDFKAVNSLEKCGVPIINLITVYGKDGKTWENDPEGLQPTVVSYRIREKDDETGFFVEERKPIPERIGRAVNRIRAWINLQEKDNGDKKVAIFYWNYPPGKQHIGASYLNVFASIDTVLKRMKDDGYDIGNEAIDEEILLENSLRYGRNIGNWVPGELDEMVKHGKCVLLPLEDYEKWIRNLPVNFIKEVTADWGPVEESNVMIWTDPKQKKKYMVIPAVRQGNVVILPQPVRGWMEDIEAMFHSKDLFPHHQYVGVYAWLKYGFGADAVIHFGTHGTHEWLPGKSGGLSGDDAPEALIQDLPVIYPYIVDDVGEGLVAKRRGSAVIVDHMIPPLKKGGLYHEYAGLEEMISSHDQALEQGAEHAGQYQENIIKKVKALGLDKDINISEYLVQGDTKNPPFPKGGLGGITHDETRNNYEVERNSHKLDHEVIHEIEEFLKEMKQLNMPYGLHTFGNAPDESLRSSTIQAIQEVMKDISAVELDKNIQEGAKRELSSMMKSMNGQFITTGTGNDPVRNPSSLPTGKNFYAFNPEKIPKKEAWQVGMKLARELLDTYQAKHNGNYPEKLSFVIWGTETIRHEGILESQILYLLGVEPIWNEWGKVTGIKVIPKEELGRPRIDIVVSSAAEEMFGQLTHYIDQAVQMVKKLDEEDNLVRQHIIELTGKLVQQGWPRKKAEQYAAIRIFDEAPGRYDLNVSRIVSASGTWEDDSVVAEEYLKRMSHGYGNGLWGEPMEEVYKMVLSGTRMVVHSRSTNVYGTLDNDDFYMYAGGLAAAIRELDGKSPGLVVTNIMNPAKPEMTPIDRMMGMELRSRYLNPEWIEGMKKEGFEGANKMSEFVENMWGWQVTVPETIDDARWEQTFEVYVEDKYGMDLKEFFGKKNPYAYQALTARMLEAVRKDYWHPTEKVKQTLATEYMETVLEHGVSCCEHTCNNPAFQQYAMDVLSTSGLVNPEILVQYAEILKTATGKTLNERKTEMDKLVQSQVPQLSKAGRPVTSLSPPPSVNPPDPSSPNSPLLPFPNPPLPSFGNPPLPPFSKGGKGGLGALGREDKRELEDLGERKETEVSLDEKTEVVNGFEMEEIKANEDKGEARRSISSSVDTSNRSWFAMIIVLGCIGFFFYGWVRKRFL